MTLDEFRKSLAQDAPPVDIDAALKGLWWQGKGDWHKAHECAQSQEDERGAWVHAHLHRVEGDEGNAGYWYRHAGKPHARTPLPQEWAEIAAALLASR